jgi:hypothetical protein
MDSELSLHRRMRTAFFSSFFYLHTHYLTCKGIQLEIQVLEKLGGAKNNSLNLNDNDSR